MIRSAAALLAYSEDIRKRGILDWLKAHTSFVRPLHRYSGNLVLSDETLTFSGKDSKTGKSYVVEIRRADITDIYLGFDEVFGRGEDRSLGIAFQPLRITMLRDGEEARMYFITDFNRLLRNTKNREWYEALRHWTQRAA